MKHAVRCTILVLACLLGSAGSAYAALYQYSLTVTDNGASSFAGSGTISFNALNGTGTAAPAFDDFAFSVTSLDGAPPGQLPLAFNDGMISSLQWAIDPITLDLTLDLDVSTQVSGAKKWDLSFDTITPFATSVTCNSTSSGSATALACYAQNVNQQDVGSSLVIASMNSGNPSAPSQVPEPNAFALLALALTLLGIARRRLVA